MTRAGVLGVVLGVAGAASLVAWQAPGPLPLPVERAANVFFAQATINGRGPYWLTVDTGATLTVLDPSTAAALNLTVRSSGPQANLGVADGAADLARSAGATIRIGQAPPFTPAPLYVIPVRAAEAALGHRIDGVLGTDFLRQYVAEFDYAAGRVTLHAPAAPGVGATGGADVAIRLRGNVLIAPATLTFADGSSATARLLVDTGSSSGLILNTPFVEAHRLDRFPIKGLTASVGINGTVASAVIGLQSVAFGDAVIPAPNAGLSRTTTGLHASRDFDGIIGAALLQRFTVTIDYPGRRMRLRWPRRRRSAGLRYNAGSIPTGLERPSTRLRRIP